MADTNVDRSEAIAQFIGVTGADHDTVCNLEELVLRSFAFQASPNYSDIPFSNLDA